MKVLGTIAACLTSIAAFAVPTASAADTLRSARSYPPCAEKKKP